MFVKNPEYFMAIVKERSISKAAERLYLCLLYTSPRLSLTVTPSRSSREEKSSNEVAADSAARMVCRRDVYKRQG